MFPVSETCVDELQVQINVGFHSAKWAAVQARVGVCLDDLPRIIGYRVKPLAYFWAAFPHWSAENVSGYSLGRRMSATEDICVQTVHIDDLARNFAMNPGEGLRVNTWA